MTEINIEADLENISQSEKDFPDFMPQYFLNAGQIICIISRTLKAINQGLGTIACKTAFIAAYITMSGLNDDRIGLEKVILLSLLHLVGDYHFFGEHRFHRENFTAQELERNYTYAYYYLKNMTPLKDDSKTVLFFDTVYKPEIASKVKQMEYASLIFTAQKLIQLIENTNGEYTEIDFDKYGLKKFNKKYINIFKKADSEKNISKKILDNSYTKDLEDWITYLKLPEAETNSLLKLMIWIMDFKSTYTVQHTIHTAAYNVAFGKFAGCSPIELNELFTAGILHDIGKMVIPDTILESTEKLTDWEYRLMQTHIRRGEEILANLVPKKIFDIAMRHHEKLNGSGYPNGLTAKQLTIQERIMAVADIFSALVDERSYKKKLEKERIFAIFDDMTKKNLLDERITAIIPDYYTLLQDYCAYYSNLLRVPMGIVEIQYLEEIANSDTVQIA